MRIVDDVVDVVDSQFLIKNVIYEILSERTFGGGYMRNVKVVFASVIVTLIVVFGFMSINSSYASAGKNAPFILALTIVNSPAGTEAVVSNYSEYDITEKEVGNGVSISRAQAFSVDVDEDDESEDEEVDDDENDEGEDANETETEVIDYDKYNIDYIGEEIAGILDEMIGSNKTVFYLPPTGYINVSRGESYGVAYALTNIDSSSGKSFVFDWTVNDSIVEDCGVSMEEGQGWIERGWGSWGNIPEGRVDPMTIYFSFPIDAPNCTVRYDFIVEKDGEFYDAKTLEFKIE